MASSSSASKRCDVFLSFRGETRYNFTSHLRKDLCRAGIDYFIDEELERGEEISSALLQVIQGSRISIVVFSQDFASSTFCLDEVVKILECKESRGQVVYPVFYHVDPSDVQDIGGNYQLAFSGHITNEKPTEQIERWKTALIKVANMSGWHIKEDTSEAEIVGKIVQAVLIRLSGGDYPLLTTKPMGRAFQINVNSILEGLKNQSVSRIGIYGMNGVGKTTLAIVVHNRLLEDRDTYGPVYWISLSPDINNYNLQNQIAKTVRVDINDEKDVKKRAAKLVQALQTKGGCILILDGLLNHFSAAEVGIPEKGNGSKLIVTTRSLKVCDHLRCDKKIKVNKLSSEEAWSLFIEELESLSPEINGIANSIVQECDGLPLGIMNIAQRMRGVKDAGEWRNMLKELRDSHIRDTRVVNEVFKVLESSYNDLNDQELQQTILYCALFPKDFKVRREKLIEYLIVEGIIERMNTRQEEYDKGIAMLNELESICLLEGMKDAVGARRVKLHNLVRHMAIQLARTGPNVAMVPKSWNEDLVRVSLISNGVDEISRTPSPKCPKLLTLLLQRNNTLKEIPDRFFSRMQNLRVLDLSYTGIIKLPASVCSLVNLTALLLNGCKSLTDMPSLKELRLLEKLDLSFTQIEEVPSGLKNLSNLRYLSLLSQKLKMVPTGVLSKLLQLQYLRVCCTSQASRDVMIEVACNLHSLETLVCWFEDIEHFNCYVSFLTRKSNRKIHLPVNYSLHVGEYVDTICSSESLDFANINCREVSLEGIACSDIHIPTGIQKVTLSKVKAENGLCLTDENDELKSLEINFCGIKSLSDFCSNLCTFQSLEKLTLVELKHLKILLAGVMAFSPQNAFCNLTMLGIVGCSTMKSLFYPEWLKNLQNLQVLHVRDCRVLQEIIVSSPGKGRDFSLPKLSDLRLVKLPNLKNICIENIICNSLQQVQLIWCQNLENIPFFLPSHSLQKLQVYPKEWWETVGWGQSTDYKMQYEPLCVFAGD